MLTTMEARTNFKEDLDHLHWHIKCRWMLWWKAVYICLDYNFFHSVKVKTKNFIYILGYNFFYFLHFPSWGDCTFIYWMTPRWTLLFLNYFYVEIFHVHYLLTMPVEKPRHMCCFSMVIYVLNLLFFHASIIDNIGILHGIKKTKFKNTYFIYLNYLWDVLKWR